MVPNERKELLDQQLKLLAEKSKGADSTRLLELTHAMCEVYLAIKTS